MRNAPWQPVYSRRLAIAREIEAWFEKLNEDLGPSRFSSPADLVNVVTAMAALGYLREPGRGDATGTIPTDQHNRT